MLSNVGYSGIYLGLNRLAQACHDSEKMGGGGAARKRKTTKHPYPSI